MCKVVIDMQALYAAAVDAALHGSEIEFDTVKSREPEQTLSLCKTRHSDVLLMDVMAYAPRTIDERLIIRDTLKRQNSKCKIVLMVDENTDKKLADKVRLAKKDGLIDDFIYGSVSPAYIAAVIDAL